MQRFDKYTVQTLGFALIVIGIFLFILGLIGGPTGTYPSCPINGCPPGPLPWYWWLPAASFFSGIGLVIVGIILVIVARSMKPEQALKSDQNIKDETMILRPRGARAVSQLYSWQL